MYAIAVCDFSPEVQESCDLIANAAVGNCMGFVMTENWVDLYCNTVVLEPDFDPMELRWMTYGIMGQVCARNGINFPLNFGHAPNRLVMGILPIYVFGGLIKSTQSSMIDPARITEGHYDRDFFCNWFHGMIGRLENITGLNIRKNVQITHKTVLNPDRLALTHHS